MHIMFAKTCVTGCGLTLLVCLLHTKCGGMCVCSGLMAMIPMVMIVTVIMAMIVVLVMVIIVPEALRHVGWLGQH